MVLTDKLNKILEWMSDYRDKNQCRGVVIGLSGGKDSTVVAMLAKRVFGDNVFAILMPNGVQKDISDSIEIAESLKLNYRIVNIETVYNIFRHVIEDRIDDTISKTEFVENCPKITDKAKTNIPPRLRMAVLYAMAQTLGYRVIGTGNKSEAYIGWTTKYGDSAYDFNPIGDLLCTEVVEVGKILANQFGLDTKFVEKKPSDGLCGKSDEESFGFTYEQLDNYIKGNYDAVPDDVKEVIKNKHLASEHKRNMPEICIC